MRETIFGIDIDPTAIDITTAVLWFEVEGRQPFAWMDRHVICGNRSPTHTSSPQAHRPTRRTRRALTR